MFHLYHDCIFLSESSGVRPDPRTSHNKAFFEGTMRQFLFAFLGLSMFLWSDDTPLPSVAAQSSHEAWVVKHTDPTLQVTAAQRPPVSKLEIPPSQPDERMIWISGYWEWIPDQDDFVWVCGIWRLPPSDRTWSPGYWQNVQSEWKWGKGVWMPKDISSWVYSEDPPPQPKDEKPGAAPDGSSFWVSGHWGYAAPDGWFAKLFNRAGEFKWVAGLWQKQNPSRTFEAAQWVWRPEGYLFVPEYWDWALDKRAVVSECKRDPLASSYFDIDSTIAQWVQTEPFPSYPAAGGYYAGYYDYYYGNYYGAALGRDWEDGGGHRGNWGGHRGYRGGHQGYWGGHQGHWAGRRRYDRGDRTRSGYRSARDGGRWR